MGKLNFCSYLISRFYPTHEIQENLMHTKMCILLYYYYHYYQFCFFLNLLQRWSKQGRLSLSTVGDKCANDNFEGKFY